MGWNGRGMWVAMHPGGNVPSLPFLFLRTPEGETVPWNASQTDVLAGDWEVVSL